MSDVPDVRFPRKPNRSEEWATPKILFEALDAEFHFDLDPCATHANTKCPRFFTQEDDGLTQSWAGARVFMNPPYGRPLERWMRKMATEPIDLGVALIPASTDTKWWHQWVEPWADELRFLRGRVRFVGAPYNAPFSSVVVIYRNRLLSQRLWGSALWASSSWLL